MKCYKIIFFTLILSLTSFLTSWSQVNGSDVDIQTFLNYDKLKYGDKFEFKVGVNFSFFVCGGNEIALKVTMPERIQTGTDFSVVSNSTDVLLASLAGSAILNGDGTKTINVVLTPGLQTQPSFTFTTITFQNLYMPASGCAPEIFPVKAELITEGLNSELCATRQDELVLGIVSPENIYLQMLIASEQNNVGYIHGFDPFSAIFAVYKDSNSPSLQSKFDIAIDLGVSMMNVRKVILMNTNYYGREASYDQKNIEFVQNGSVLTFSTEDISTLTWNQLSFRIYFDLTCSNIGSSESFNASVGVTPYPLCSNQAAPVLTLTKQYNYTCFDDTEALSKPAITYYSGGNGSSSACVTSCGDESRVLLEIDNTFNTNSYSDFEYIVDVADNMTPTYVSAYYYWGSRPIDITANVLSYQVCGSSEWISAPSLNYSFPASPKIDKIKIYYENFPAGRSSDFVFLYKASAIDCAGNTIIQPVGPITTSFKINGLLVVAKDIPQVVNQVCSSKFLQENIEQTPGGFSFTAPIPVINKNQEHYAKLSFYNINSNVSNYSYEYLLNSNLVFANQEILFTVSNSVTPVLSDYVDAATARIVYPEFAQMTFSFVGNKLLVEHLNISDNCGLRRYLHVLVKIKTSAYPLAGTFQNTFPKCSSVPGQVCTPANFRINFSTAATTQLFVDCDEIKQLQKPNLRPDQDFSYNFVFVNQGNAPIKDIVGLFTLPQVGSKLTFSTVNSNSEYDIKIRCDAINSNSFIRAYQVDPNGNKVGQDFEVDFDFLNGTNSQGQPIQLCLDDLKYHDNAGCEPNCNQTLCNNWKPNTCNDNNVKYLRFRTFSNFQLEAFNKLVITTVFKTPAASYGKKATGIYVAQGTFVTEGVENRTLSLVSDPVTITLAPRSSCEPPEFECKDCVTSFSPIAGEKYLLSAWVKEEYINLYPDTYKNAAIQLLFNDGEIKLPYMKADGPIIDGWQRVNTEFMVPIGANDIEVNLLNLNVVGGGNVYFDDIRIHPLRSNMKSFVYNPSTQKLTAELDENNYATLYEYDDEGILIRVKKETERGVMTIKETRMNQSKINSGQ